MIADPHEAEDGGQPSPFEVRLLFYGCAGAIVVVLAAVAFFTG